MQEFSGCPLQEIYMLFPSISRWQWHPFSTSGASQDGTLTFHIKKYGSFTKAGAAVAVAVALR